MSKEESEIAGAPRDICERTFWFAARIIRLVQAVPRTQAGNVVARQLIRSGTSVGANVEEAQGGHTKKEFARRMNIARPEARETLYWLRLIQETELVAKSRMKDIIGEADELVRILTTIVKRTRRE